MPVMGGMEDSSLERLLMSATLTSERLPAGSLIDMKPADFFSMMPVTTLPSFKVKVINP